MTNTDRNETLPAARHADCSHNYGGPAHQTSVTFVFSGIVHRAVRFWRSDSLSTGKIEIYTIEPHNPDSTVTELGWNTFSAEDFLRYADESNPSKVDLLAMSAIASASKGTYWSLHTDSAARFAAMELS
jgi:hypothetical protein